MERENSWVLRKIATSKSLNVHNNLEERNVKKEILRNRERETLKRLKNKFTKRPPKIFF
jgi:hypothetical protein